MISADENFSFSLGRGQDNEVRVADISVSRCHSLVRFMAQNFYLEDNNSKFGTLVLAKQAILIKKNASLAIQAKRTVIYFSLREPQNIFLSCLACCKGSSKISPEIPQLSSLPYHSCEIEDLENEEQNAEVIPESF